MSSPVEPVGVDHIAINVSDVPGAVMFYTEKMGLVQNHTRPDFGFPGAWLDTVNGQQVHLIEAEVPKNVGQHFALAFDDLDAPPVKVSGADVPMPYAANLERLALPSTAQVIAAAKSVCYA